MSATEVRWAGAGELADMVVPVESLTPDAQNPRRGDVLRIARSLERFGQLKPIVTDSRGTIIAGNQVYRAAIEVVGWTHVAAVMADHLDEDEATMAGLADNLTADSATYDHELVAAHRRALLLKADQAETPEVGAALREAAEDLTRLAAKASSPDAFPVIDPGGMSVDFCCAECGYEWSGGGG